MSAKRRRTARPLCRGSSRRIPDEVMEDANQHARNRALCYQCHQLIRIWWRSGHRPCYGDHVDPTARPGVTPPPKEQMALL